VTAISYHDTVNDLQGLSFAGTGPFARTEWFALLEAAGAKPMIPLARNDSGAVALPLMKNGYGLVGLSNWYAFTWQDLSTGHADRDGLLEGLARDLAHRTGRVVLDKLPDEDGTATRLAEAFRATGWIVVSEPSDRNHVLNVAGQPYAQYLASRPGPLRTTLKRKAGKVDVEILTGFDAALWAA
jgi:hypothetical protein